MLQINPQPELHPLFETLGYVLGFVAYRRQSPISEDPLTSQQRWNIIAAAIVGALVGSRLLGLLEQLPLASITLAQLLAPTGGKTIVGGLLGGWLGVELTKRLSGIPFRTGDPFAIPLCIGIAVGRIGCLLAGLADDTYGKPTSLPWGVNFGDGIARHPTQAYEIVFLAALAFALHRLKARPFRQGALFRFFLAAYLTWRLLIDFLKPEPIAFGLSNIQWACVVGLTLLFATRQAASNTGATANEYA